MWAADPALLYYGGKVIENPEMVRIVIDCRVSDDER